MVGVFNNWALTWGAYGFGISLFAAHTYRNYIELNWTKKLNTIDTRTVSEFVWVLCKLVFVQTIDTECASEVCDRRSHTSHAHRQTRIHVVAHIVCQQTHTARTNERTSERSMLCVVVRGSFMLYVFMPKLRKDLFSWKSYEPQNRRALIEVPCVCCVVAATFCTFTSFRSNWTNLFFLCIARNCSVNCYRVYVSLLSRH